MGRLSPIAQKYELHPFKTRLHVAGLRLFLDELLVIAIHEGMSDLDGVYLHGQTLKNTAPL